MPSHVQNSAELRRTTVSSGRGLAKELAYISVYHFSVKYKQNLVLARSCNQVLRRSNSMIFNRIFSNFRITLQEKSTISAQREGILHRPGLICFQIELVCLTATV